MGKKLLLIPLWILFCLPTLLWGQTCPTSVSISSNQGNTICQGTEVIFTASPSGGNGTFKYRWKIGNTVQSETGNTIQRNNLQNNQLVSVTITEAGGTTPIACSINEASITMTVNALKIPSVNISTTSGIKCVGTIVQFTATDQNGGNSSNPPTFAWYVNGNTTAAQTGASKQFSASSLPVGNNSIRVVMTSGLDCVTSQTAENTVNVTITGDANIALTSGTASPTLCVNTSLTPIVYTISSSGNNATVSGLPSGLTGSYNSSTKRFTISGSPTVTGTFPYTVNATGPCKNKTITGTITVNPNATISLDSGNNNQTVCQGQVISNIVYSIGQTGNNASITGLPAGISGSYSNGKFTISGSTNTSGTYNYTIAATGTCGNSQTLNGSLTINENLTPEITISSSDSDNTICADESVTFSINAMANEGSSPSYQWKINGTNVNGENSSTFTTTNLQNGDIVTLDLTSSETCITSGNTTVTSNAITTSVNPNLTPSVTITDVTDTDICPGDSVTFTATPVYGGTTPSYQWQVDGNNVGTNSNTFTTSSLTDGQIVTVILTSNETCLTTGTAVSEEVAIEVFPPAPDTPGPITGDLEVCYNGTNLNYSVSPVANAETYVWTLPSGWTITGGEGTNSISVDAATTDGVISVLASNTCGDSSGSSQISVTSIDGVPANPGPVTSDLSGNADAACPPATANFSVAATGNFEWTIPDAWEIVSGAGTNSIQVNITTATGSGTYSVSVVSQNICGDSTPSSYDNIVIDNHIIADFGDDQTVCSTANSIQLNGTRSFGDATLDVEFSTTGSGTFTGSNVGGNNKNGPFSVTYNPTQADKNAGAVTLTMTVPEPRRQDNAGNDCGASEDSVTITFIQDATISTPSNIDQTICINQPLDDIIFSITDAGTDATVTGLPAGLSGNFDSGNYTISGTPTEAGTFNYTVATLGDCAQQTSISGTLTVTPDNTITDASNKDQEICINNAIADMAFAINETVTSVTSSGLPVGVSGNIVGNEFILTGIPTESGVFNYTLVTSGSCETAETSGTLTVQPDITISTPTNKDQTVCINTAITDIEFTVTDPGTGANITGTLPAGLSGSFNNGIFTISGSPTEAGTFNYSVNTEGACENATESGTITVKPDPTATISYDSEFCVSQTNAIPVILNGTGAEDSDWQGGTFSASQDGLSIDSNTGTITGSASTPGTYTVTYQGPDACVRAVASTTVIINPTPTVELSYAGPFCNSDTTLQNPVFENGVGAWQGGTFSATPGGLDIDANTGEINPNLSNPADYTITYTIPASAGCEEVEVTAQVIITQLPQASIFYPESICTSETSVPVDFDTTPAEYQTGIFSATNGLSIDASGIIDPSSSSVGLHTVTYTIAAEDGCEDVVVTDEIEIFDNVIINTQPINTGICSSETATFEVVASGSNLTYQWYRDVNGTPEAIPGEIDPILTITTANSTDAGSYYAIVSGHNSCSSVTSDSATLNVDENIVITEPTEDITICEDSAGSITFLFKGHANGEVLNFAWYKDGVIVTEDPGKIDFNESGPDGNLGEYTGELTISSPVQADSGIYYVVVDGPDYFTCSEAVSPSFNFTVNPPDSPPTTTDVTYCLNDVADPLSATINSGNEIKWYDENYTLLGDTFTPPTTNVGTFTYYATQTKSYPNSNNTGFIGCESDFEPLIVTVLPKPEQLSENTIVYEYCFDEEVAAAITINPTGIGESVNWYDSETGTSSIPAPIPNTSTSGTTTYWVSQVTSEGCESDRTRIEILINPLPNLQISVANSGEPTVCLGSTINLIASGATSYTWSLDGNEIGTEANLTHEPSNIGLNTYVVSGIDENGCTNITEIDIEVEEPSQGGNLTGPSSVCTGENSGTLVLTDELGEIVRWEQSTDGTNWTPITETTSEYSFQNLATATSFRAVVKNGVCEEAYSNEVSITIDPLPVAGGVLFKGTDRVFMMCEFPTDEYLVPLQLSGTYVGEIVAWEYRRSSASEWLPIQENGQNFTGNALTGAQVNEAAENESTLFRVEVQSGACEPNVYSDYATLSIIPSDIAPSPVQITPGEVCLGEIVTMSSSTGYGGSGTFQGGAFDNSSIANHGWRVMRLNADTYTEYTFESAADNTRPERWMRTNPHDYQMDDPNDPGSIIWQRFDSCSCDAGNKGFAIVSGDNPSTLETPVFNLYTMENPTLTFDQAYNLTAEDVIRVELSLDGGNTYEVVLMEISGPTVSGNYAFFGDDGLGEPNNMSIDLSQWAGMPNLRVRWLYDGTTGGIYTIDDIGLPEDPQNVQLIWYYDEDINDPNNTLEQIGEVNQSTVTYPQDGAQWPKIGWNDFEVQTALVFDTNGDPCESAENSAVASVYVFDNYTSTAEALVGECGNTDVQLSASITSAFYQEDITEFPDGEGSTLAWEIIEAPDGYTFSEDHFVNSDPNLSPINDPNAVFQPPLEGNYTIRWAITPNESQTTRDVLGEMITQDIGANPCPMVHNDTTFEFIDCTTLDFDGDDDYIDLGNNYNGNYFIEAWIRPFDRPLDDGTGDTDASSGVIFSSSGMEIRMESLTGVTKNGRWHHIAVANNGDIWVDGIAVGNIDVSGSGINNTSIGARYNANTKTTSNHFSGWIEELRIWNGNNPPNEEEIRFMMNQRIQLNPTAGNNTPIEGEVVPNRSVAGSYLVDGSGNNLHFKGYDAGNNEILEPFYNQTWGDLAGYYRLYSDEPDPANLIPGYFDPALEPANGFTPDHSINKVPGRLYNITTDQENTSPTPYFDNITQNGQNWETDNTWARPDVWDPPNSSGYGGTSIDWNIARINTNISSSSKNITMLGLLSETMNKELTIESDQFIRISHYLLLDGNMDLVSESQLLQDHGSILAEESAGWLERDQQGRMSSFNYNYWTSPVSLQGAANNSGFVLESVLWDGTNPNSPGDINFVENYFAADGAKTNPITISSMWIWNFLGGQADIYGDWTHLSHNGLGPTGTGYSMKGTDGTIGPNVDTQNYIFKGKPHNGIIELNIGQNQNYLIGNPYASALDGHQFILDNIKELGTIKGYNPNGNIFNGSLYFWDHFSGNTHILEEYIGGYGVLNLSSNVGIPAISSDWRINITNETSPNKPTRYIPVAQGFFVNSTTQDGNSFSGEIVLKNNQRVFVKENGEPASYPSTFLIHDDNNVKSQASFKQTVFPGDDTRAKIRVKFQSPAGYHRQILVTRDAGTTNGFDLGYDAPLIENNAEDMYWIVNDSKYVIQGVPHFEKDQVLPLAIKTKAEGQFTIKIDSTENWPVGKELYLRDLELDSIHDILNTAYVGTAGEGENKERFELIFYNPNEEVATTDPDPIDPDPIDPDPANPEDLPIIDNLVGISYSHFSRQVKISNWDLLEVKKVMIFDMNGKLIQEFNGLPTQEEILLSLRPVRSGVYIVKAFCENGICNKKIVIK